MKLARVRELLESHLRPLEESNPLINWQVFKDQVVGGFMDSLELETRDSDEVIVEPVATPRLTVWGNQETCTIKAFQVQYPDGTEGRLHIPKSYRRDVPAIWLPILAWMCGRLNTEVTSEMVKRGLRWKGAGVNDRIRAGLAKLSVEHANIVTRRTGTALGERKTVWYTLRVTAVEWRDMSELDS